MTSVQSAPTPNTLDRAVAELCPMIVTRLAGVRSKGWSEYLMRRELVGCILASRVKSSTAQSATLRLESAALLDGPWWYLRSSSEYERRVQRVLAAKEEVRGGESAYRFHRTKAAAVAGARDALLETPLHELLANGSGPEATRAIIVRMIPGLGPKQASMFLRNVGFTMDLAIIDSHIIRFMELRSLRVDCPFRIGSLQWYKTAEGRLREYAASFNVPVGILDWALWIVMVALGRRAA